MSEGRINTEELGAILKRTREKKRLSLRKVADLTGVSFNTLSRMERGIGTPDAENLTRVSEWIGMPVARLVAGGRRKDGEPVIYYPNESTPDIIQAHLNADPALTPDKKKALGELFRTAYEQFTSLQRK